jgi:hypothetical protein
MSTTSHFDCIIQTTQALYDNPWHVERTTAGGTIMYECRLVFSLGQWYLFITMPGSRYPFTEDLKAGDTLHVVERNIGTGEEDIGTVMVKTDQAPPFYAKIYSYTAHMLRTIP